MVDSVFEKLLIDMMCDSLLNVVRCGVGVFLKFVKMLFLMISSLCLVVSVSSWCVMGGVSVVLVGLCSVVLVMYRCGWCLVSICLKCMRLGLFGVKGMLMICV